MLGSLLLTAGFVSTVQGAKTSPLRSRSSANVVRSALVADKRKRPMAWSGTTKSMVKVTTPGSTSKSVSQTAVCDEVVLTFLIDHPVEEFPSVDWTGV